jgi:hypothetical protein
MPDIYLPSRPLPGMQAASVHQKFRLATCAEFECEWFLQGREGEDGGKPFTHPQGVACGDFSRCKPCATSRRSQCGACEPCRLGTANCPCLGRLARSEQNPNVRGHLVPDERIIPVTAIAKAEGRRLVTPDEWLYRLHEGVDSLIQIREHGL